MGIEELHQRPMPPVTLMPDQYNAIAMKKIYTVLLLCCALLWQCSKDAASSKFGTQTGTGGSLARFTIAGSYLYTVDDQQLKVFDISNPADPVLKNTVDVGFSIETVFPFKDRLFIGSSSVVYIFSLTDPSRPQKLAEAISPQVMRRCDPVVAKDTVAYATLRTSGPCGGTQSLLVCYDIRDVSKPVQKGTFNVNEPYGLGYAGDVLYVCDKSQLMVFDISKAYQPQLLKGISGASYVDVIPYGDLLICWVTTGIIVYDITDPRNPVQLSKIS